MIHLPENVRLKVIRDIVRAQYFLPARPFKTTLLINTPVQFTKNASWEAKNFKCTACQFSDCVRVLFANNLAR